MSNDVVAFPLATKSDVIKPHRATLVQPHQVLLQIILHTTK